MEKAAFLKFRLLRMFVPALVYPVQLPVSPAPQPPLGFALKKRLESNE